MGLGIATLALQLLQDLPCTRQDLFGYTSQGRHLKSIAAARRAGHYLHTSTAPHSTVSSTSKVFVTQTAFEVANDALQLMGGVGLTKDYPMEKLLRDARSALIEDGENFFLTLRLGTTVCELYQSGWAND